MTAPMRTAKARALGAVALCRALAVRARAELERRRVPGHLKAEGSADQPALDRERDKALVQEQVHRLDELFSFRDQLRVAQVLQELHRFLRRSGSFCPFGYFLYGLRLRTRRLAAFRAMARKPGRRARKS
jgi:hypothetical protein